MFTFISLYLLISLKHNNVALAVFPNPIKEIFFASELFSLSIVIAATAPVRIVVIQVPSRNDISSPDTESYSKISPLSAGILFGILDTTFTPNLFKKGI